MRLSGRLMAVAVGDTCGSPWEFSPYKDLDLNGLREVMSFEYKEGHGKFGDITGTPLMKHRNPMAIKCPVIPNYTDDTVCTFALAEAILKGEDLAENLRARCLEDPVAGYGHMFYKWLQTPQLGAYNSYGNGSAMRCSIAGWLADSASEAEEMAEKTAEITHNHPEAIKGARCTAHMLWMFADGAEKDAIKKAWDFYSKYRDVKYEGIQPVYRFDVTCEGSVPVAMKCFEESTSFEDCILKCIKTGGDVDTLGAIIAPIAYAYYKDVPDYMVRYVEKRLPDWMVMVSNELEDVLKRKGKAEI